MSDHLYRSRDDRMLAGVAGGLAELWDADPSLVRLVWALLVIFTGGIALVVYIVMAIVVPEGDDEFVQPATPAPANVLRRRPGGRARIGGDRARFGAGRARPDPGGRAAGGLLGAEQRPIAGRRARGTPGGSPARRGDSVAPAVIGVFLVLLGGFFLARQWLPELDWDWFWPVMLIGARRPAPRPGPGSATQRSWCAAHDAGTPRFADRRHLVDRPGTRLPDP